MSIDVLGWVFDGTQWHFLFKETKEPLTGQPPFITPLTPLKWPPLSWSSLPLCGRTLDIGSIFACKTHKGCWRKTAPLESGLMVLGPLYWITFSQAYQELIWLLVLCLCDQGSGLEVVLIFKCFSRHILHNHVGINQRISLHEYWYPATRGRK